MQWVQCWVPALPNYNFQILYKAGKSNVEADALSHIPWQQARLECLDLCCLTVKAIITGYTTETSLFEAYSGKTVIPPQTPYSLISGSLSKPSHY